REKAITPLTIARDSPATLFAVAWNPDKPEVVPYSLSDTQAQPQGDPEAGLCPGGNSGCPPLAASSPGAGASFPVVLPQPCQSPIITQQTASPVPGTIASPPAEVSPPPSPGASV